MKRAIGLIIGLASIGLWARGEPLRLGIYDNPPMTFSEQGRPTAPLDLVAAVEAAYHIALPGFHDLEAVRVGATRIGRSAAAPLFSRYLDEVSTLVRVIDAA